MKKCKLCQQEKALIKKSHIIPDFMYKGMFDENHKLICQPFRYGQVEKREIKQPSDGEYEAGLLCENCDNNLLGYFENYSSKAIYGGQLPEDELPIFQGCINPQGIGFIKCQRLNYQKYKLFLLSILWRASISTRPFFGEIKLTNEHEEEIRNMILSKNAGDVSKYPVIIYSYANDHNLPKHLIAQPRQVSSTNELQVYSFIINGYFYNFYINKSSAILPQHVTEETIKPNNELNLIIIPDGKGLDFILAQFGLKP